MIKRKQFLTISPFGVRFFYLSSMAIIMLIFPSL